MQESYYNLPQAPGKYEEAVLQGASIYDEVEKERCPVNGFICGVPIIPFAYVVCFYVFLEGIIILLEDPSLGLAGPFANSESVYLDVVAWGDVITALIGAVGIWFGHNLVPVGWREVAKLHSTIAVMCTGLLLVWRGLVCLSFAPWAGIMLAFSPPTSSRVWQYILICLYLGFSIFLVYVLALAFRQVALDSRRFQNHLNTQALAERQQLLREVSRSHKEGAFVDGDAMHSHEVEPHLFGCLMLAETVSLYAAIITIVCVWNFLELIFTEKSSGGWAFFASTSKVSSTYWLEAFLWPISFGFALVGLAGALSFTGRGFLESKPSVASLLVFLIGSMFRFGLLFAVTGMDLIEKDLCGFYINGLAKLAYRSPFDTMNGVNLSCSGGDFLVLILTIVCCALDGYLIWGTFQLWHHAQDWTIEEIPMKGKYASLEDERGGI